MKKKHHPSIIIEFIGMPGVGKTTLSKILSEKYKRDGSFNVKEPTNKVENLKKFERVLYKLRLMIRACIMNPILVFNILYVVIKSKQKRLFDFIVVLTNLIFIVSLYKEKLRHKEISIYDQGLFQAIWAMIYSSNNYENIEFVEKVIKLVLKKRS